MGADPTRRAIVAGVPLALLTVHPAFRTRVWAQAPSTGRLIVQRAVPLAAEMPLSGFGTWITPNDLFHILTVMANPLPAIEPAAWRLAVDGQVEQTVTLTYEQLKALPARKVVAVLECAGNSRNSVSPPLERSHLGNGYVGNAEWLGVPLHRILERAGLTPSAREVVLEGADRGKPAFAPEEVAFAKSLPLEKALHPDTLLVYAMNGVPLPREHGGPVRAVVPGWYGTYHVKWLERVSVIDRPFDGVFMARAWRVQRRRDGAVHDEPVTQVAVKSLVVRPEADAKLTVGTHAVAGVAWSGGKDIASVQVSTDGGRTWDFAQLVESQAIYAWRFWEFAWRVAQPGSYTLMARATDTSGTSQPFAYDLDLGGFAVSQVQPVRVEVS